MSRGSCLARGRGTQTEIIDGTLINGVAHVWVQRRHDDMTMTASDGRVYRAIAHVSAHSFSSLQTSTTQSGGTRSST
jgi:hypothetical protein